MASVGARFSGGKSSPHSRSSSGHHCHSGQFSPLPGLLAGGFAGGLAKTVVAPVERVKILYQVNPSSRYSLALARHTAAEIIHRHGWADLWRGNLANLARVVPYSAVVFVSYDLFYEALGSSLSSSRRPSASIWHREGLEKKGGHLGGIPFGEFLAGAAAGTTATVLTYPLDLLRARGAVECGKEFGYLPMLRHILRSEGPKGLFHGLSPTLVGIIPYCGLNFAAYHSLKDLARHRLHLQPGQEIPLGVSLGAGALSGLFAQSCTYPLDVIRRRMQVQGKSCPSFRVVLGSVCRSEGVVKGLFKGLSLNWAQGSVSVSVSFVLNDLLRDWLGATRH